MPEDRPLRVALAGAGWVSAHHLRGWRTVPAARVVAVCDHDIARARARATEFDIPEVFSDTGEMLAALSPDALDIVAPPDVHAALCACATAHGIPALCQKPLAPTLAAAQAIAAAATGRIRLMVHENWRFRAPYRRVRAWLQQGRIGTLATFRLHAASAGLLPDAHARLPALVRQPLLATLPRLAIGELLIHHLDVSRWLLGPLRVTSCRTGRVCREVAGEDSAVIELASASGVAAEVSGTFTDYNAAATPTDSLEIVGSAGRIRFDGRLLELAGEQPECVEYDPDLVYEDSYAATIRHFADALRSGAPFETAPEDNLQTLLLVEDAYRAAGRRDRD
jgi:D-apiose dehydrogenase